MRRLVVFLVLTFSLIALACNFNIDGDDEIDNPAQTDEPAANGTPAGSIKFALIVTEGGEPSGTPVGCGDSLVMVNSNRSMLGDPSADLRAALEHLFSLDSEAIAGYTDAFADADITLQDVTVNGAGAVVNLSGFLQLSGVCADARMRAQLLHTIFQFEDIQNVTVYIDGVNLQALFDMSGQTGPDDPFTRADL